MQGLCSSREPQPHVVFMPEMKVSLQLSSIHTVKVLDEKKKTRSKLTDEYHSQKRRLCNNASGNRTTC